MNRIKVKKETAVYHCMSRVVGGQMLLGDQEKEIFRKQMLQVAEFCGIEILTFCIMGNHFHILLKVPYIEDNEISNQELVRRYSILYPVPTPRHPMTSEVVEQILKRGGTEAEKLRSELLSRMHDVSKFIKTLKQRFTIWYNHTHGRFGTLWAERYKSLIVENTRATKMIVAAYIDLNPVRAKIVADPKDYRFSGYGESCAGIKSAKKGLNTILEQYSSVDSNKAIEAYRMLLYSKGSNPVNRKKEQGGIINHKDYEKINRRENGKLTNEELLRCRVRYFTQGVALGNKEFVEHIYLNNSECFGMNRKSGARAIRGIEDKELFVIRDLQKDGICPSE